MNFIISLFRQTTSNQGQILTMKLGGKWFLSIVIPSLENLVSLMKREQETLKQNKAKQNKKAALTAISLLLQSLSYNN